MKTQARGRGASWLVRTLGIVLVGSLLAATPARAN